MDSIDNTISKPNTFEEVLPQPEKNLPVDLGNAEDRKVLELEMMSGSILQNSALEKAAKQKQYELDKIERDKLQETKKLEFVERKWVERDGVRKYVRVMKYIEKEIKELNLE